MSVFSYLLSKHWSMFISIYFYLSVFSCCLLFFIRWTECKEHEKYISKNFFLFIIAILCVRFTNWPTCYSHTTCTTTIHFVGQVYFLDVFSVFYAADVYNFKPSLIVSSFFSVFIKLIKKKCNIIDNKTLPHIVFLVLIISDAAHSSNFNYWG